MEMQLIDFDHITALLNGVSQPTEAQVEAVLAKRNISAEDVAVLINTTDKALVQRIFTEAGRRKQDIYGNRIVIFAPLYLSNYCTNNCSYCGYRRDNLLTRRRLTQTEIEREVKTLLHSGHKRLVVEVGEDPVNAPLAYVLESIRTIYGVKEGNDSIRRINVNIAATSVDSYRRLKEAGIGTYILFQETYHRPTYEAVHPRSLKGDFLYHLHAPTRAMEAGLDDIGGGVLFGLSDWRFEVIAMFLHNRALQQSTGVGFHTLSVPRLKQAEGMKLEEYPHLVDDATFKRIVAILRLAVPEAGLILSTRESAELRREVIRLGISQMSAGSCTDVGGYHEADPLHTTAQFEVEDTRPALDVLKGLIAEGDLPSYCTACYRAGRTGDRFMELARTGNIQNVCQPNALMTLMEYAVGHGDAELRQLVDDLCKRELPRIHSEKMRLYTINALKRIREGETDLFV